MFPLRLLSLLYGLCTVEALRRRWLLNEEKSGPFLFSFIQGCSREEQRPSPAGGLQRPKRSSAWRCHLAGSLRRLSNRSCMFEQTGRSTAILPKGRRADSRFEGVRLHWGCRQLEDEIREQSCTYNHRGMEMQRKKRILTSVADHLRDLILRTWVRHGPLITGSLSVVRLHKTRVSDTPVSGWRANTSTRLLHHNS